MQCLVCRSAMTETTEWSRHCTACGFAQSKLTPGAGRGVDGLDTLRLANFDRLLDQVARTRPLDNLSILEIGSAEGWFLDRARARGARVAGVEPSPVHAAMAREKGHDVREGFFPAALRDGETFDVLVFNDVFEHLPDPDNAIRDCERLLRPGGLLILNLPTTDGVLYRIARAAARFGLRGPLERLWQVGLPSPHVTYFSRRSLRTFVEHRTALQEVEQFELDTLSRRGLKERVFSTVDGVIGLALFAGLWLAAPLFRVLPRDIMVKVFEKPQSAGGAV